MKTQAEETAATRVSLKLWQVYDVRLNFLNALCASVPADSALVQSWIEARKPRVKPAGAKSIEKINEEVLASLERGEGEPDEEFNMLVFQRHRGCLVLRAGTVKAHIKDCARVLSAQFIGRIEHERAFSTRIANGVYQDERVEWLSVMRDGEPLTSADGMRDKPVHARGPRGVVNALKRFEYVEPPCEVQFQLKVLLGGSVSLRDLETVLTYGGVHGYGGERGDGKGRYEYEINVGPQC